MQVQPENLQGGQERLQHPECALRGGGEGADGADDPLRRARAHAGPGGGGRAREPPGAAEPLHRTEEGREANLRHPLRGDREHRGREERGRGVPAEEDGGRDGGEAGVHGELHHGAAGGGGAGGEPRHPDDRGGAGGVP